MTVTRPLVNCDTECSAWDAFDIPRSNTVNISEILRKDFSLTGTQSDVTIFKCVNKQYVKETAKAYLGEFKEVKIAETTQGISSVFDIAGERVFPDKDAIFGWLIFIDKNPLANWGHECEYIFFVHDKLKFSAQKWMPPMNIALEEIQ